MGRGWTFFGRIVGQRHGGHRADTIFRAGRADLQCLTNNFLTARNASPTVRQAVGSEVPVQPNSIKKRDRSVRRELNP